MASEVSGDTERVPHAVERTPQRSMSRAAALRLNRITRAGWVRLHDAALIWLALTIAYVAPFGGTESFGQPVPLAGLDPSWITGLNLARGSGLHFGRDLVFTYGPLGFLDVPEAVSRLNMVGALGFSAVAAAAMWTALRHAVLRAIAGPWAAPVAALITIIVSRFFYPSTLLFAACGYFGFAIVAGTMARRRHRPALLAATAAVLVLVKFSEGIALLGVAVVVVLYSYRRKPRGIALATASYGATFLVLWLGTGQSLGDIWLWLRSALSISSGYTDAMALESAGPDGYVAGILITLLVLVPLVWVGRRDAGSFAALLVAIIVLYLGWKEGFVRHDVGHEYTLFVLALPLVVAVLPAWRTIAGRWVPVAAIVSLIGIGMATGYIGIGTLVSGLNPRPASQHLADEYKILTDSRYQTRTLEKARIQTVKVYNVPPTLIAAVGSRPVIIDPWDVTVAWAYHLNWRPVPIFQTYVAYTSYLDERNTSALVRAPAGSAVLRGSGPGVDGRNPLWDSPRYNLAVVCNGAVEQAQGSWMLLGKLGATRCGAEQTATTVQVRTGQRIDVPAAPDTNTTVVMHFTPSGPGPFARVLWTIAKPGNPLRIKVDGGTFRIPRQLADGPLIVRMSPAVGWPENFGGLTDYRQVSFSEPGVVRFAYVPVR